MRDVAFPDGPVGAIDGVAEVTGDARRQRHRERSRYRPPDITRGARGVELTHVGAPVVESEDVGNGERGGKICQGALLVQGATHVERADTGRWLRRAIAARLTTTSHSDPADAASARRRRPSGRRRSSRRRRGGRATRPPRHADSRPAPASSPEPYNDRAAARASRRPAATAPAPSRGTRSPRKSSRVFPARPPARRRRRAPSAPRHWTTSGRQPSADFAIARICRLTCWICAGVISVPKKGCSFSAAIASALSGWSCKTISQWSRCSSSRRFFLHQRAKAAWSATVRWAASRRR